MIYWEIKNLNIQLYLMAWKKIDVFFPFVQKGLMPTWVHSDIAPLKVFVALQNVSLSTVWKKRHIFYNLKLAKWNVGGSESQLSQPNHRQLKLDGW